MTIRELELHEMDAAAAVHRASLLHAWTFQRNIVARSFYESRKFVRIKETDGLGNAEKEPDVLYFWSCES